MDWLAENWFFALLFVAFIAMHLFGHGHGGHGRDRATPPPEDPPRAIGETARHAH